MTPFARIFERMRRVVCVLLASVVAVGLGGCSKKEKAAPPPSLTTTTALPEFRVVVPAVDVQSMKPGPAALPADVKAKVEATLNAYLAKAVIEPLYTGQPPVGLDAVFTPVALARLLPGSPDRAALLEDTRPAEGVLEPEKENASLTALAAQDGSIALVSAAIELNVLFTTTAGRVRYQRSGQLVLIPWADGWRVDSYDVVAKRDSVPPPPANTTTTGPGE